MEVMNLVLLILSLTITYTFAASKNAIPSIPARQASFPYWKCDAASEDSRYRLYPIASNPSPDTYCFTIETLPSCPQSKSACCTADFDSLELDADRICSESTIVSATLNGEQVTADWNVPTFPKNVATIRVSHLGLTVNTASRSKLCLQLDGPCNKMEHLSSTHSSSMHYSMFSSDKLCCPSGSARVFTPATQDTAPAVSNSKPFFFKQGKPVATNLPKHSVAISVKRTESPLSLPEAVFLKYLISSKCLAGIEGVSSPQVSQILTTTTISFSIDTIEEFNRFQQNCPESGGLGQRIMGDFNLACKTPTPDTHTEYIDFVTFAYTTGHSWTVKPICMYSAPPPPMSFPFVVCSRTAQMGFQLDPRIVEHVNNDGTTSYCWTVTAPQSCYGDACGSGLKKVELWMNKKCSAAVKGLRQRGQLKAATFDSAKSPKVLRWDTLDWPSKTLLPSNLCIDLDTSICDLENLCASYSDSSCVLSLFDTSQKSCPLFFTFLPEWV